MTWQKVVRHISDSRIVVQSKSGNQYPVTTKYESLGESLYSQLVNEAHDSKTYWAWVNFDGAEGPILEDYKISDEYPQSPPWEH